MSVFDLDRMLGDLRHRVHILETTQPMGYSSVSEGRSRFVGNESLLVEGSAKVAGWLVVTGTERITGLLEGSGTLDWTGPCNLKGKVTVTGDTDFIGRLTTTGDVELGGNTVIKKDLDVQAKTRLRGKVTLEADLEILPGGKIKAGTMVIDTTGGGSVTFANGARVGSSGATVSVLMGTSAVTVDNNSAKLSAAGKAVEVNGSGIMFSPSGVPQVTGTGYPPGMLIMDPGTGKLSRVYS